MKPRNQSIGGGPRPRGRRRWTRAAAACALVALGSFAAAEAVKTSEKAKILVVLSSSEEETEFLVDGKSVGTSKEVEILVEKDRKYEIRAKPVGYRERVDTIEPPQRKGRRVHFQFLIGDRAGRPQSRE